MYSYEKYQILYIYQYSDKVFTCVWFYAKKLYSQKYKCFLASFAWN